MTDKANTEIYSLFLHDALAIFQIGNEKKAAKSEGTGASRV